MPYPSRVSGRVYDDDPSITTTPRGRETGSVAVATVAKSADYTLVPGTDQVVLVTTGSAGNKTMTLPSATTASGNAGRVFEIWKVDAGTSAVAFATASSQTINGAAASGKTLTAQWTGFRFVSDGSNWVAHTLTGA